MSSMNPKSVWPSMHPAPNIAIIGANGGIGKALSQYIDTCDFAGTLLKFSRNGSTGIEDEDIVAEYADRAARHCPLDAVIVATGVLHDDQGLRPEKRLADINAASLARAFEVNAIGPALIAKHFLPLLRRDCKTVFVALSARVGSISDNRLSLQSLQKRSVAIHGGDSA